MTYHVDTSGAPLTSSQLPIAGGAAGPGLAGDLPVQAGIRDPAQTVNFILATLRETDPAGYTKFLRHVAALKRKSGLDVDAEANMLTGALNVESDSHTTMARAQVSNPSATAAMLAKLSKSGSSARRGPDLTALGGGLYSINSAKPKLTVGLVGNQLLLGRATPAQLRVFAAAPATSTASGTGSVAFRIALPELLRLTLKRSPSAIEQQILGMLGDITGSAEATTTGLTGTATLAIR